MAFPNILIMSVKVTIESLDRSKTTWDDDAGEAIGNANRRETFEIDAQVHFSKEDQPDPEHGGVREEIKGYIVVRSLDLDKLGKTIKRGDRLAKIKDRDVNFYITENDSDVHWAATDFIRYTFRDRHPVKQEGQL